MKEGKINYYDESYILFEKDFLKYSAHEMPPTFLTYDIEKCMNATGHNYFCLPGQHAFDGRDHYFYFVKKKTKRGEIFFEYVKHSYKLEE